MFGSSLYSFFKFYYKSFACKITLSEMPCRTRQYSCATILKNRSRIAYFLMEFLGKASPEKIENFFGAFHTKFTI